MAVASAGQAVYPLSKPLAATAKLKQSVPPPVYISTNPSHVIPQQLQTLYSLSTHSVHRFPHSLNTARHVDLNRLRTALSHSYVVVSVFAHPESVSCYASGRGGDRKKEGGTEWLLWLRRWGVAGSERGELVGFGRAVSDCALTASIHDVMVLPPLQRMGIGRMIVNRILRVLTSRGIYDISALCSEEERLFFNACGFGNDILESTTMMYTRTVSPDEENQTVLQVGRKQLLIPPDKKPFKKRV